MRNWRPREALGRGRVRFDLPSVVFLGRRAVWLRHEPLRRRCAVVRALVLAGRFLEEPADTLIEVRWKGPEASALLADPLLQSTVRRRRTKQQERDDVAAD